MFVFSENSAYFLTLLSGISRIIGSIPTLATILSMSDTHTPSLVLGSASPRRRALLRRLGVCFETLPVETREIHNAADPVGTVVHNALAKQVPCRALRPDACIITADTLVWFDGRLFGKPRDLDEAADFLRAFSGRT